MNRSRLWLLAIAPILVVAILATQHLAFADNSDSPILRTFESCADLHDRYVELALESRDHPINERRWWNDPGYEEDGPFDESDFSLPVSSHRDSESVQSSPSQSDRQAITEGGTNVVNRAFGQSDVIQTDGKYFYILRPGSLLIARIDDQGVPTEVGRLQLEELAFRQELIVYDDRAVVLRQLYSKSIALDFNEELIGHPLSELPQPETPASHQLSQSIVLEVDVSDVSAPEVIRELNLDGAFLSARLYGDSLSVLMRHDSPVPRHEERWFNEPDQVAEAEKYNEALVKSFMIAHWYPQFALQDTVADSTSSGHAIQCTHTFAPREQLPIYSHRPAIMTYALSFDRTEGLASWGAVAMLGMPEAPTTYAPYQSLYFATTFNDRFDTAIHQFDISDPLAPSYSGSGVLVGRLVSQWSLSEHNGYLRVATYDRYRKPTEARVTVLSPPSADLSEAESTSSDSSVLEQVGLLSALGAGHYVGPVRFAGESAYFITNDWGSGSSWDILDISDPSDPRNVGSFVASGSTQYLHPLPGEAVLAFGLPRFQQAGGTVGYQVVLYDLSDSANPIWVQVLSLGDNAASRLESDIRAFHYQDGTAWIPIRPYFLHYDDHNRHPHDGAYLAVEVSTSGLIHRSTFRVHGHALRAFANTDSVHLLSEKELRTYSIGDRRFAGGIWFPFEWDNRWVPLPPN